ncbi:hypothetical protein EC951288_4630, partial [Escherichia coli 95.1288]
MAHNTHPLFIINPDSHYLYSPNCRITRNEQFLCFIVGNFIQRVFHFFMDFVLFVVYFFNKNICGFFI